MIDNVYKAFIEYLKLFGYTDANIWRVNQNGGPINPPCVIVAIGSSESDSTNLSQDVFNAQTNTYSHTAARVATMKVTLDFYGANSLDNASSVAVAFEDAVNFDIFTKNNIIPIESSEPQQLPFIGQDSLDYDRFQIVCSVNYNPTNTVVSDYATQIDPDVIRVQNIQ